MKKREPVLILLLLSAVFVFLFVKWALPPGRKAESPPAASAAQSTAAKPEPQRPAADPPEATAAEPAAAPDPEKEPEPVYLAFDDGKHNAGIYLNSPAEVSALEEKPDLLGWFEDWQGELSVNKLDYCRERRITPIITWLPKGVPLGGIAAGHYDDYLHAFFSRIREDYGDMDVLIRFAHEMETRQDQILWYSWQLPGGEDYYKAMWEHVVSLGREEAPNIKWIWSPNRLDGFSKKYYPGDEYVDYIGVTLNLRSTRFRLYRDFGDFYEREGKKQYLDAAGKKIILGEVACAAADAEQKNEYLKSIFSYVREDPLIVGVVVFNENVSEDRQFNITDEPLFMDSFYEGIRSFRNEQ